MHYVELRENAIRYLCSMREGDTWGFRFSQANPPTLIATCVAGMFAGFLDYAGRFSGHERARWAEHIRGFQNAEGWFEDEDIDDDHRLAWYGRDRALFHRTRHALCALSVLGAAPVRPLRMTEAWLGPGRMTAWLETLALTDYWYASNMMMDAFLLLWHEHHFGDHRTEAQAAIGELLDFCDDATDPATGYHDRGQSDVRNAMAGAMHLFPAYFLCGRAPRYPETVVRTTLALQQEDGLFGYESGSGGEDCLDYDAVLILSNFYFLTPRYAGQIEDALRRCQQGIAVCLNADGGFAPHRRDEPYNFGTRRTTVAPGHSSLWATYGRLLTIAMAGMVLEPENVPFVLGNSLMEVWDGGAGRMEFCPARVSGLQARVSKAELGRSSDGR